MFNTANNTLSILCCMHIIGCLYWRLLVYIIRDMNHQKNLIFCFHFNLSFWLLTHFYIEIFGLYTNLIILWQTYASFHSDWNGIFLRGGERGLIIIWMFTAILTVPEVNQQDRSWTGSGRHHDIGHYTAVGGWIEGEHPAGRLSRIARQLARTCSKQTTLLLTNSVISIFFTILTKLQKISLVLWSVIAYSLTCITV